MTVTKTILCIDAGFRHTGVAVWDCLKNRFVYSLVLSFPPSQERYVLLESTRVVRTTAKRLATIIRTWQPKLVVAELPFGGARNSRAATCMALACATVVSTCELCGVRLHPIRPQEIKKWVSGYGNRKVSKAEVIKHVTERFGASCLPKTSRAEHVADAMASLGVWKDCYERK